MLKPVVLLFGLLIAQVSSAQTLKIAYINVDQILSEAPQFIQANQRVIKEFQPQELQLQQQAKTLQNRVDEFNQQSATLTQTQRSEQLKAIAKLENEIKRQAQQIKATLQQRNQEELGKIQALINKAIEQIAKQEQYDLILYQEVAYVNDKIDISQQISQQLKEWFKWW